VQLKIGLFTTGYLSFHANITTGIMELYMFIEFVTHDAVAVMRRPGERLG